ncbi:hypothetical protein [Micromonospora cremea]|uniref:Uncharacterized protein n=1 Tax=Micromonospora cremea TaxID=709881 RepID=A0A1N6BDY4_9ACTN|nr:hypothetical protein [Micromonospora cremea]SIN44498.1 hypothetical protein SAMN04489832_7267 [Micromonospora cremea]
MGFDLVVLAVEPSATADVVRQMADHCTGMEHRDGELDQRIVSFYEELRARFPDHPPYDPESPWMSAPLAVGIDHVSMNISYSPRGNAAVDVVLDLAERHGLVIYDPQFDEVFGLREDYEVPVGLGDY